MSPQTTDAEKNGQTHRESESLPPSTPIQATAKKLLSHDLRMPAREKCKETSISSTLVLQIAQIGGHGHWPHLRDL